MKKVTSILDFDSHVKIKLKNKKELSEIQDALFELEIGWVELGALKLDIDDVKYIYVIWNEGHGEFEIHNGWDDTRGFRNCGYTEFKFIDGEIFYNPEN